MAKRHASILETIGNTPVVRINRLAIGVIEAAGTSWQRKPA
ncbi:MAG: hypothetical protein WAO95_12555 [Burkholderiales bacterium]